MIDATPRTWLLTALPALLAVVLALGLLVRPAEAAPAPTVTTVTPALGPSVGGTGITLTGTGFVAGATVTVGGAAATGVTVVSATSITATTPAGTAGSTAVIIVTNADTQSATLSGTFTFQYPAPTVTGVAPATGSSAGATGVTITGTNFRAGATVSVGGTPATSIIVTGATSIVATTPPHTIGVVPITVTNSDGQGASLASAFTYTAATAPTVTSVTPTSGTIAGGIVVTILGANFVTGATVTFGGVAASSVTVSSSGMILATTPAQTAAGVMNLVVTNPDTQSGLLSAPFTYTPRPAPTLSAVTPATGRAIGGTTITLVGTNFVAGATVTIGGAPASSVVVVSGSSITAATPGGTAGLSPIIVTNPDSQTATLASSFTYTANAAPTLTTVAPIDGPVAGGTLLTLTGTNFLPGAMVLIDGAVASSTTVISASLISTITPPHIAAAVAMRVMNYDGQSATTTATGFTYKLAPTPTLTTVAPDSGPLVGGGLVTLTGTNFVSGATVSFGAFSASSVSVTSATTITATVPLGVAGPTVVVVRNPDGQAASLSAGYAYVGDGPMVTTVTPDAGSAGGGTVVTINGDGFVKGATVTFGTTAATKVVYVSAYELTATAPAGVEGAVDIAVANPSTAPAVLSGAFSYLAPGSPTVASVPTAAGGVTIVLAGTADIQALIKAQKFPVSAIYLLDVAKQTWKVYVVGAPVSVNTLTALKPTDIVILRR